MTAAQSTVALTGASGLIGGALRAALAQAGYSVISLVRRTPSGPDEAEWSPERGVIQPQRLEGIVALVHLAGENIAAGRWSRRRMDAIRGSRIDATSALVDSLTRLRTPPNAFLCASAVGIYGDRGDDWLTEQSDPGHGFLPDVCQAWEAVAGKAREKLGARVVHLRFGVVLAPTGGMLARLLLPFRLGLGGPVGSGRQYLSWISLADVVGAVQHALRDERIAGPVNVVAPTPVTNREFARTLGRVLHRPAVLRVPATLLRLALGRLADEALLASARAKPAVLLDTGYAFRHPNLDGALRDLLAPRLANGEVA
jgi:hypothetical protein